jgi:hypothetical protein
MQQAIARYRSDPGHPLGVLMPILRLAELVRNNVDLSMKAVMIIVENFTYSEIYSNSYLHDYMYDMLERPKLYLENTHAWAKYIEWEAGGVEQDVNVYF